MLFIKKITKITFEDVVNFCNEQIRESIHLDYKKNFPADLEKTISAFANTMGGLIIIGVEDKDGKPKLPVRGLKYERGLNERVTNIILSNIYPPVFPEIQVCDPIRNRTFVIIRVPQSNTDHWIRHRTEIYIRTGDITKPERLATRDEIEWLRDKRKKSEELRETLYDITSERYNNYLKLHKLSGIPFSEATILIAPLYPAEPYKSPQEIKQISEEIKVRGYGNNKFPNFFYGITRPVQGGVANFFYNEDTQYIRYTELNQFGLLYHKEDLGILDKVKIKKEGKEKIEEVKRTYLFSIICLIDLFLEASANLYEKLGYWGLVEFKFSLEKLLGIQLISIGGKFLFDEEKNISIDERLKWQREYYVNDIKNRRVELLIELIKDIGWSLGWEYITEDRIKAVLKENGRLPEIRVSTQASTS